VGTTSRSSAEDLQRLLEGSDVVSIHCPLTAATAGLVGLPQLRAMKPGALLLNCARGEVVDKTGLLQALREGRLGGVGLDVHWVEPADPDDELYRQGGQHVV
jgi:phosphoglycerate dehydrogenase-like enzyme